MNQEHKRQLLAHVLSGNLDALRAYQTQQALNGLDTRIVIDCRAMGGSIEAIDSTGNLQEITLDEFNALPGPFRKRSCITIIDTTGGQPTPAPDEDYSDLAEQL